MNFSLKNAPESNFNKNNTNSETTPRVAYQKPGIEDNLVVQSVTLGFSSLNKVPFIQLNTVNTKGEIGKSNRMWLSTTKNKNLDGSEKSMTGFDITARNIVDLIVVTHNISRDEAKQIELVPEGESNTEKIHQLLINKLSNLLVGRPFRGKFKGEQARRQDGTPGSVYATLDLVESMTVSKEESRLRFSQERDVKLLEETTTTTDSKNEDLPF